MTNNYFGNTSLNYLTYVPVIPAPNSAPYLGTSDQKETKSDNKGVSLGGLDSEMVKWLYKEGLPSDVESFLHDLSFAINNAYNPISGKAILSPFKLMLPRLADIKHQKEMFTKAYDKLLDKDALNEIALTANGRLVVVTKDGRTDTKLFTDLQEGDVVLTNGDLARTRSQDKSAAWDTNLINIMANGTSIQDITEHLNNSIKTLGKTTVERIQELPKEEQQKYQGLGQIQKIMNGTIKYEELNENQQIQYQMALNWLKATLPKNMQTLLDIKGAQLNMSSDNLIAQWLGMQTSTKVKQSQTLSGSGNGSGSGKDNSTKLPEALQWLYGLGERSTFIIQTNTKDGFILPATVGAIQDSNGNIGITTLKKVSESKFGGMLNLGQVTIANQLIPIANLSDVIVDGNNLYKMELPYDELEYSINKVYKPDLDLFARIQEAEAEVTKQKAWDDPDKINEIYQSKQLPIKYQNGTKNLTARYKTFGVLNAYTTQKVFGNEDLDIDLTYVKTIEDENTIQNIMNAVNTGLSDSEKKEFNDGWFNSDTMYQTTVFIPVRNNYFNANSGNSNLPTTNEAFNVIEPAQQQRDRLANSRLTGEKP